MIKVLRHGQYVEMGAMVGIDPSSDGLARAQRLGVATTHEGVAGLIKMDVFKDIDIVFDATAASAHIKNDKLLREHKPTIRMVDLTPAAIGPYCVPVANLDAYIDELNVNMVTCGGQATIPVIAAVSQVAKVHYAEIVASIASKSAGPGTRAAGPLASAAVEALDIIPVGLPVPQTAENLSKRTLTSSLNDWNAVFTWQVLDFVKWHIDAPLGSSSVFVVINKKKFDRLPEAAKAALEKHGGKTFVSRWSEGLGNENERLKQDLLQRDDHVIITPTEDEISKWKQAVSPVISEWVSSVPEGERVWEVYTKTIADVRAQ